MNSPNRRPVVVLNGNYPQKPSHAEHESELHDAEAAKKTVYDEIEIEFETENVVGVARERRPVFGSRCEAPLVHRAVLGLEWGSK